jgi:hypothetical protein
VTGVEISVAAVQAAEANPQYDPPLRGIPRVLCETCAGEIEAYGLREETFFGPVHVWRHVSDGTCSCVVRRGVRPFDDFKAGRALRAARLAAEEAEVKAAIRCLVERGVTGEMYERLLAALHPEAVTTDG